jgi:hypothetical protein
MAALIVPPPAPPDDPIPWFTERLRRAGGFAPIGADGSRVRRDGDSIAAVLTVLTQAVAALHDDDHPYRVVFNKASASAGTDLEGKMVEVGSKPLSDPALTDGQMAAVMAGLVLHEVGHICYSRQYTGSVNRAFGGAENVTGAIRTLSNLAADCHDEAAAMALFPGLAPAIAVTLWWVSGKGEAERRLCSEALQRSAVDRVNLAIAATRYPWQVEWDTVEALEWLDWWTDWARRAHDAGEPKEHAAMVVEAIAKVRAFVPRKEPSQTPIPDEPEGAPEEDADEGEDEGDGSSGESEDAEDEDAPEGDEPGDGDSDEDEGEGEDAEGEPQDEGEPEGSDEGPDGDEPEDDGDESDGSDEPADAPGGKDEDEDGEDADGGSEPVQSRDMSDGDEDEGEGEGEDGADGQPGGAEDRSDDEPEDPTDEDEDPTHTSGGGVTEHTDKGSLASDMSDWEQSNALREENTYQRGMQDPCAADAAKAMYTDQRLQMQAEAALKGTREGARARVYNHAASRYFESYTHGGKRGHVVRMVPRVKGNQWGFDL